MIETSEEKRERMREGLEEIRLLKLKEFSTANLARELCSRDRCLAKELDADSYYVEIWRHRDTDEDDLCFRHNLHGPAKIIIVKGVE